MQINAIEDVTFIRDHVSMQGTLVREHLRTKTHWHVST